MLPVLENVKLIFLPFFWSPRINNNDLQTFGFTFRLSPDVLEGLLGAQEMTLAVLLEQGFRSREEAAAGL